MSNHIPPRLRPGSTVAVVATARAVDAKALKTGIDIIKGWGLNVIEGNWLFQSANLFAGTDQQRLEDLQRVLDNPEVEAIFCARGGYGTTRIIDQLSWKSFKKHPKWICGFSDVTALLCHVESLGYACLHSSMPQLFAKSNAGDDYRSLHRALFSREVKVSASHHPINQKGSADGPVTGGNLSLLVHLIGTESDVDTRGKILMIEDVDEYLYHLDRMMVQLVRSGKLRHIKGLIVGHLTKMKEGDLKFGTDACGIIKSHLPNKKIPVAFGFPMGHESPNLAIPMGVSCNFEVTEGGSTITLKY